MWYTIGMKTGSSRVPIKPLQGKRFVCFGQYTDKSEAQFMTNFWRDVERDALDSDDVCLVYRPKQKGGRKPKWQVLVEVNASQERIILYARKVNKVNRQMRTKAIQRRQREASNGAS